MERGSSGFQGCAVDTCIAVCGVCCNRCHTESRLSMMGYLYCESGLSDPMRKGKRLGAVGGYKECVTIFSFGDILTSPLSAVASIRYATRD